MFISGSPHPASIKDTFVVPTWHSTFPFPEGILKPPFYDEFCQIYFLSGFNGPVFH